MKTAAFFLLTLAFGIMLGFYAPQYLNLNSDSNKPVVNPTPIPTPLNRYAFDALQNYQPIASQIEIQATMFEEVDLTAYLATYQTDGKTMSLQLMVSKSATPSAGFPAIVLHRGFVDPSNYQTGIGTRNFARFAAARGYVTLAPDFLGFGSSDPPAIDSMEARVEKTAQLLDLIASLEKLTFVNPSQLGFWGHSNGGQIALSLLTITNKPYPTVLWAPVTKPFPYSILYYTDSYTDKGKTLRKTLAEFETIYDVDRFNIEPFLNRLSAPLQIHQGGKDAAVPLDWNDDFVNNLEERGIDVDYHRYPSADHNLVPHWQDVAIKSINFFDLHLK